MKKGRGVGGHVTYVDGGDGLAAVELEVQGRGPRRRGGGAGVQGTRRRGAGDAAAAVCRARGGGIDEEARRGGGIDEEARRGGGVDEEVAPSTSAARWRGPASRRPGKSRTEVAAGRGRGSGGAPKTRVGRGGAAEDDRQSVEEEEKGHANIYNTRLRYRVIKSTGA